MKKDNNPDFVEIFSGSPIDAEIVKSLLNDSGIKTFLKDEYMGTIAPWYSAPGGAGSVKVIISGMDYEKGKEVVDNYYNNINSEEN